MHNKYVLVMEASACYIWCTEDRSIYTRKSDWEMNLHILLPSASRSLIRLNIWRFCRHIVLGLKISVICPLILSALVAASLPPPTEWTPWDGKTGRAPRHRCLSDQDVQVTVKTFESFSQKLNFSLVTMALAPEFHSYSYSVIRLGCHRISVSILVTCDLRCCQCLKFK